MHCRDTLQVTCCALTALIALLYGSHFDDNPLAQLHLGRKTISTRTEHDVSSVTITLCATAEVLGCFELLKPRIPFLVKSSPAYWKDVAESPREHLILATKLGMQNSIEMLCAAS